jgi:4-oxalocrotonate tautomerase
MPHVIVRLWPGKSEQQKKEARRRDHGSGDGGASLRRGVGVGCYGGGRGGGLDREVYNSDILTKRDTLYKESGYKS